MLKKLACCFLMISVLAGCERTTSLSQNSESTVSSSSVKALATFNRGAALLEQYRYSDAARAFETVLDIEPGWTAARFNLGIAYLNMQEQEGAEDYLGDARLAFEAVLQSEPDHLHARFCLGLYYQHLGENENALECFQAVHVGDSEDPYVAYRYAETLLGAGRTEEGIKMLEKVIELDPGFISAVYRLAMQYQRAKHRDKAKQLIMRFKNLKETELTGGTFAVLKTYGTSGKYYMALGADNLPLSRAGDPETRRILFSPEPMGFDYEVSAWQCAGGTVALAGIAVGDVDGDGDLDLCMTAFGGNGETCLWRNDSKGKFTKGACIAEKGISPCFGDVDNDGDIDLWLGCAGSDVYFENDGKGNFSKSDAASLTGGDLITHSARLFDIDSDGDLDLLAFRLKLGCVPVAASAPAESSLYNNNRDGSFTDIAEKLGLAFPKQSVAASVYDDFDNDRDLDMVIFPAGEEAAIAWVNDRIWEYHTLDVETTGLSAGGVISATSGDPDKDGDRDLLIFTDKGIRLFANQGNFRFESDSDFANSCGRLGGSGGQFADMDNDGDLDIVIADAVRDDGSRGPALLINDWPRKRFINASEIDPGNLLGAISTEAGASCVVADFTGNGKCDILLAAIGQKPFVLENITPGGHWIEIDLLGRRELDNKSRSNNSAIGARVEIKAGSISQQYVIGSPSGPVSMEAYRIHAGLGKHDKVDWLRIIWPDGVLQAELELATDQVLMINELQRKTSSCPHLFVWDGTHFEFVSDFAGMGAVGYLLGAPGNYEPPDCTEYLPLPNIEPLDGEYVLKPMEPLEELVYFDEAKLLAVDHPEGTKVYPHEMMPASAPPPPFELFCFSDAIEPVRAVDHRGVDVTSEIRAIDRKYAGAVELDKRFTGFAKEHFVDMDFGDRLEAVSPQARLVLFIYGWVEYGYSATNFSASQAGLVFKAPTVEALRDGKWVELLSNVGYPAGIRHMMTIDVTGKVLNTDRRVRVSSNMELYWDWMFMAPVLDEAVLSVKEVSATSAELRFLGFPRVYTPDGARPNLYDYDNIDRAVPWKTHAGYFTRFGDVTELVDEADDCFVIMGRGEEITLRFSAEAFGPIPQGYCRSFILKSNCFSKDMDMCGAFPDTVEPLPFHGMSGYPYGPDEHYPDDEKHREYRRRYNTRQMGRFGN